jgi:hypothetical protein
MLARYQTAPRSAPASYPAMFERIVAHYPLPDSALMVLAARRAEAIRDHLLSQAGVPADRVRTGGLDEVDGADRRDIASTLELVPLAVGSALPQGTAQARAGG